LTSCWKEKRSYLIQHAQYGLREGSVGFFDIEGNLFGSLADAIYGQFLDSRLSSIYRADERVVVEGERKARFNGSPYIHFPPIARNSCFWIITARRSS
jgi:hypothetical protein